MWRGEALLRVYWLWIASSGGWPLSRISFFPPKQLWGIKGIIFFMQRLPYIFLRLWMASPLHIVSLICCLVHTYHESHCSKNPHSKHSLLALIAALKFLFIAVTKQSNCTNVTPEKANKQLWAKPTLRQNEASRWADESEKGPGSISGRVVIRKARGQGHESATYWLSVVLASVHSLSTGLQA